MTKTKKTVFVVLGFALFIFAVVFIFDQLLIKSVPENRNIVVQENADLRMILPQGFGGEDYQEKLFDITHDKTIWLPLCYESIGVDDAEDVCCGFKKGYLREYKNYDSVNGTKFTEVKLKLYINEYETAAAAKEAASFLTIDVSMPVIKIDGAGVIGWDLGDSNDARYTLVSGNYLITALGHPAAKELIGEIIKSCKK